MVNPRRARVRVPPPVLPAVVLRARVPDEPELPEPVREAPTGGADDGLTPTRSATPFMLWLFVPFVAVILWELLTS